MITITLSSVPPSLNEYIRLHWAQKKKLRVRYGREVAMLLMKHGWRMPVEKGEIPPKRVLVVICRPRRLDPDNAYGSMKPVLDGMRDWRVLRNDSRAQLELEVRQELSREPRLEISIFEWSETMPVAADKNLFGQGGY